MNETGNERSDAWSLLAEIDALRDLLEKTYAAEGTFSPKVLQVSQKLDEQISCYLKLKKDWS